MEQGDKKDIHALLEETITERKTVLTKWENAFQLNTPATENDIHSQLRETIIQHKRMMKQWDGFFLSDENKKAA